MNPAKPETIIDRDAAVLLPATRQQWTQPEEMLMIDFVNKPMQIVQWVGLLEPSNENCNENCWSLTKTTQHFVGHSGFSPRSVIICFLGLFTKAAF